MTTRLNDLADQLAAGKKPKARKASTSSGGLVANPPHGEKGDFLKVTVTLPPDVYKLLADEAQRRKINKEPNPQISAILREAAVQYLAGT